MHVRGEFSPRRIGLEEGLFTMELNLSDGLTAFFVWKRAPERRDGCHERDIGGFFGLACINTTYTPISATTGVGSQALHSFSVEAMVTFARQLLAEYFLSKLCLTNALHSNLNIKHSMIFTLLGEAR